MNDGGKIYCCKSWENEWLVYGEGERAGIIAGEAFDDYDRAADYACASAIKTKCEWVIGCDHTLAQNDAGIVYCNKCGRDLADIDDDPDGWTMKAESDR
jgi:hypothetical protein